MICNIGDIVLVSNFKYPDGSDGSLHSIVTMLNIHLKMMNQTNKNQLRKS
ncbi:MAG: hypothetical protein LBD23_08235 [Oscillospiraceae bacterium]|jgi:hypothetical protein|nr:hypothetical protein [Oscillospiraceae bacterium]